MEAPFVSKRPIDRISISPKWMQFGGVRIVTLSEGDATHLHIGLKGTMNALFLKDSPDKVRPGLRGRVEHGKSDDGNSYSYEVVKKFAADGDPVRGDRTINEPARTVIRCIFTEYAAGKSLTRFELTKSRYRDHRSGHVTHGPCILASHLGQIWPYGR